MQRTSSSAPGHQAPTPETAETTENELEARQAPQYQQSGSGAPPPRPDVNTRDDMRFNFFLKREERDAGIRAMQYVQELMVSQQGTVDRFTRLLNAMDEDREIDPRSRTDIPSLIDPQVLGFQQQTFELSPDVLASCLVSHPAANQDGSPV